MPTGEQIASKYKGYPERLLNHVKETANQGDVDNVINVIDNYCYTVERSMHVGDLKGGILDSCVKECNPKTVLELGTFCGYGSLRIAKQLGDGVILHTIEFDPDNASVAEEIIEFAGMSHKIKILRGKSSEVLPNFKKNGITSFDFIFVDHWKEAYKPDIILIEELGLLKNGSVVLADNVIYPGCPDYLEYIRNHPKFECSNYPCKLEYCDIDDAMEKSVYKV